MPARGAIDASLLGGRGVAGGRGDALGMAGESGLGQGDRAPGPDGDAVAQLVEAAIGAFE